MITEDSFDGDLHDALAAHEDRKKIQQLIDDGIIRPEELANARVIELFCPNNPDHGLTEDGMLCEECKTEPISKDITDERR